MWKKAENPLQVRIVKNSIMSHNEVIERLSIELRRIQYIIPVLCTSNQPCHDIIMEIIFKDYILCAHRQYAKSYS